MSALALERPQIQASRALTDYARDARFGTRVQNARLRAGITQAAAARNTDVTVGTWRSWESGLRAPRYWRLSHIAAALGCTVAELAEDAPQGVCVAEVWLSPASVRQVRQGGRAAALEVAERLARALEPELWRAATGRIPRDQDTPARARPRRSRAQVLAGWQAAQAAATAARLAYAQGELQRIEADRAQLDSD